jgi:hypothetical protein
VFRKKRNADTMPNIKVTRVITILAIAPFDKPLRSLGKKVELFEFPTCAFELPPCFPRASTTVMTMGVPDLTFASQV